MPRQQDRTGGQAEARTPPAPLPRQSPRQRAEATRRCAVPRRSRPPPDRQTAHAPVDTADEAPAADSRELRTAFSAPPSASSNGLLTGAQPVVPVGTFDSRWSGLR